MPLREAWLRLSGSDTSGVNNLRGWLTTVVARVSLDMLRSRRSRREDPLGVHLPDPIVSREEGIDPEHEALLADSVGLAMLVVFERLPPAERLAFVLHDVFAVPFDEIAPIVGALRPQQGSSQAAPAAGWRTRRSFPTPTSNASEKLWAPSSPPPAAATSTRLSQCSRDCDGYEIHTPHLPGLRPASGSPPGDPDVVLRADRGPEPGASRVIRGAQTVAKQALAFSRKRTSSDNGQSSISWTGGEYPGRDYSGHISADGRPSASR